MFFDPALVDGSRKSKALTIDLTPVLLDREKQCAEFLGSSGDIYETDLRRCSCSDFSFNLQGQKPCKHMIRLAMELGLYPSDGMKSDPLYLKAKAAVLELRNVIETETWSEALSVAQFALRLSSGIPADMIDRNIDIQKLVDLGVVVMSKKRIVKVSKAWAKPVKSVVDAFLRRFSEYVEANLLESEMVGFIQKLDM